MVTRTTSPEPASWVCRILILLLLGFCSVDVIDAQDFGAVRKRLAQAVEAGEISEKQAKVMLEALTKSSEGKKSPEPTMEAKKRRYAELEKKLQAAIKEGIMSREDAVKKLTEAREAMFGETKKKTEEGQGTPDFEAKKRRYEEFKNRLQAAVKEGTMSEEEAEKKLLQTREAMFGEPKKKTGEGRENPDFEAKKRRYAELEKKLQKELKEGVVSKEEAEKKLIEAREAMFGGTKEKSKSKPRGNSKKENSEQAANRKRLEQAEERIRIGIEKGLITAEEGQARLEAMKTKLFGKKK